MNLNEVFSFSIHYMYLMIPLVLSTLMNYLAISLSMAVLISSIVATCPSNFI